LFCFVSEFKFVHLNEAEKTMALEVSFVDREGEDDAAMTNRDDRDNAESSEQVANDHDFGTEMQSKPTISLPADVQRKINLKADEATAHVLDDNTNNNDHKLLESELIEDSVEPISSPRPIALSTSSTVSSPTAFDTVNNTPLPVTERAMSCVIYVPGYLNSTKDPFIESHNIKEAIGHGEHYRLQWESEYLALLGNGFKKYIGSSLTLSLALSLSLSLFSQSHECWLS
jgi:hypothetical protein